MKWLTPKQIELEKKYWIKFYKNNRWKLTYKTTIEYEKHLIEQRFQEAIKQITAWYSQAEIDTWNTKVAEAKKVLAGEWSKILSNLLIEWETLEELATKILEKAKQYADIYYKAEKEKRQALKELEDKYKE